MPSIIIEQAVTNVDILVEPQITTFEVVLTEMQVPGTDGDNGWSPLLVADAITIPTKTLLKLSDWIGGEGDKPTLYIGQWQKADGTYTAIASEANDIKGADGVDGITQDISGKEDLSNKKIDVETNKTSDTFYPSIKSIVDWVTNFFVKGSGTANYLPKFGVGGKVVGDSLMFDNGTNVGIGTEVFNSTAIFSLKSLSTYFSFNRGSGNQTPNISLGLSTGKSLALLAGTSGTTFTFDNTGTFSISSDTKANIDGGSTGGGSVFHIMVKNGNILIGTTVDNGVNKLQINGSVSSTSSVRVGDNTAVASATNVGATRYRATANNSYLETCMQVGASSYSWIVVKTNVW